ncbi:hypothetical protein KC328_g34 [Hortaea werneckii]|nr:hypothetical protein KC328_g34 [Hortaea werneckii]
MQYIVGLRRVPLGDALTLGGGVAWRDFLDALANGADGSGSWEGADLEGVGDAFQVARRHFDSEGDVGRRYLTLVRQISR